MSWGYKLRSNLGNYKLSREIKNLKREPRFINFSDSKKIGFLFDGSDEMYYGPIMQYIKKIAKQKEVKVLAYWNKKDIPDNPLKKLDVDYFTKKDLNFSLIPQARNAREFAKIPFDILITININKCFPLQYITALSKAHLRVGMYNPDNALLFDLMINQQVGEGLKDYFIEVDHYLNLINKNVEKA
jgi:hypothetical protein